MTTTKAPTTTKILRRALLAASTDTARMSINQILIEPAGEHGMWLTSTNGHWLSRILIPDEQWADEPVKLPVKAARAALELMRDEDYVEVRSEDGQLSFGVDGAHVSAPSNATFPPYAQVIPAQGEGFSARRRDLAQDVKDVQDDGDKALPAILVTAEGLRDYSIDAEGVAVNRHYLVAAIKALGAGTGDEIRVEIRGELDPITLHFGESVAVIVPVR